MGVGSLRRSLFLSVALHVMLFLAWAILLGRRTAETPKRYTYIELEPTSKIPTKKSETKRDETRIVQTERGQKTKEAAPDAFLGERTQTVDRQTVSREAQTVMGTARTHAQAQKEPADTQTAEKERVLSKFGIPILPKPDAPEKEEDEFTAGTDVLNPQEYIKGFRPGERTVLNTKEYVFYSYFQQIRQRLDWAWNQNLREKLTKLYRSGRMLASDTDHTTKVMVTLNPKGEVVRVQVLEESGTRDLDDAAIRAFNDAGPFPNPPRGIVDPVGEVRLRWDFILRS